MGNNNVSVSKMKTAEVCFLEIVKTVQTHKNNKIDNGELLGALHRFSKLRNFECNYMYDGTVRLTPELHLVYFFSGLRSCISIKHVPSTSYYESLDTLQDLTNQYVEKLFTTYSIDVFISNLHSTINKN